MASCSVIGAACLLFLLNGSPAGAWATAPTVSEQVDDLRPYILPRTVTFEISNAAGDAYEIMVAWPDGPPPSSGWPVLYVLDGEDSFAIAALTARRLARAGTRSGIGHGLVVGISAGPLPRRVRDYTPPSPGYAIPKGQPASGLTTGGSEEFLDMLAAKVMPAVRQRWTVDENRETLAGHSFGGLLAMHALLTRPRLFDAGVAVSPSLWFGEGLIDREIDRAPGTSASRRLLLAEADEGVSNSAPVRAVETLQKNVPAIQATFLPLPGQSHGTTFLAAIAPAIRFAFGKSEQ